MAYSSAQAQSWPSLGRLLPDQVLFSPFLSHTSHSAFWLAEKQKAEGYPSCISVCWWNWKAKLITLMVKRSNVFDSWEKESELVPGTAGLGKMETESPILKRASPLHSSWSKLGKAAGCNLLSFTLMLLTLCWQCCPKSSAEQHSPVHLQDMGGQEGN